MAAEESKITPQGTRLFSTYLKADDDLHTDAVMLWEVIGNEIQTIALRVAAKGMKGLDTAS